ncbi:MAG TPA: hypothetical protein VMT85_12305 [Thermoanaerobaculia bacterium]|nr:hypothetical protein [Thermoanaerobaculia bacterium]
MKSRRAAATLSLAAFALAALGGVVLLGGLAIASEAAQGPTRTSAEARVALRHDPVLSDAVDALERGRDTFRNDAFGSNLFFSDSLRLNEVLANVTPSQALALGVKVDADALPRSVIRAIRRGAVDLDDPAVTRLLFEQWAVVGVVARVEEEELRDLGITCAWCHSTVDDSVAPGIGRRLDGWPNRDLDVGRILSLAPDLSAFTDLLGVDDATVRAVLESWGPGRFDAHLNLDGKAFRPDGETSAVLIPPAYGLAGVNLATYTGWGSITYWNAFVANLEMHGLGSFSDPRLADADRFPLAAGAGLDQVRASPDLVTPKLADLHLYQLALEAPRPSEGSFDPEAAARGAAVFAGRAECARCHVPPLYTEPGYNLHEPEEIGIDSFQADRSPTGKYRTTPLAGLWSRSRGGYYHDGRFATLDDVIDHYDMFFGLELSASERADLAEFLRSL